MFPYSPRPNTPAAELPGQLSRKLKEERCRELIALGNIMTERYLQSWTGRETVFLPEERIGGCWEGYTPEYIRVRLNSEAECVQGRPVRIRLTGVSSRTMCGIL